MSNTPTKSKVDDQPEKSRNLVAALQPKIETKMVDSPIKVVTKSVVGGNPTDKPLHL